MLELHVLLSGHRHLCFMDLYASALPPPSLSYIHISKAQYTRYTGTNSFLPT